MGVKGEVGVAKGGDVAGVVGGCVRAEVGSGEGGVAGGGGLEPERRRGRREEMEMWMM